jgi:hypothetical protein
MKVAPLELALESGGVFRFGSIVRTHGAGGLTEKEPLARALPAVRATEQQSSRTSHTNFGARGERQLERWAQHAGIRKNVFERESKAGGIVNFLCDFA